jgi:hypothetical protein
MVRAGFLLQMIVLIQRSVYYYFWLVMNDSRVLRLFVKEISLCWEGGCCTALASPVEHGSRLVPYVIFLIRNAGRVSLKGMLA